VFLENFLIRILVVLYVLFRCKKIIKNLLRKAIAEKVKSLEAVGLLLIFLGMSFSFFNVTRVPAYFFVGIGLIFFFKEYLKEFSAFGLKISLQTEIKEGKKILLELKHIELLNFFREKCQYYSNDIGNFYATYIYLLNKRAQFLNELTVRFSNKICKEKLEEIDKILIESLVCKIRNASELSSLLAEAVPCSFERFSEELRKILDGPYQENKIFKLDEKMVISLIEKILNYHSDHDPSNNSGGSDLVAYLEGQYKKYEEKSHGH